MRDFTLQAYELYVGAIRRALSRFVRFDEYLTAPITDGSFCLVRHDVDRHPERALTMAMLERQLNISATYFFRTKRHTFRSHLIRRIAELGHEIGYHYESLSDANGNMQAALEDFARNLDRLREVSPIKTIAMHGRPLKPFDNRDIWRDPDRHNLLASKFGLLGEVYLDIDYSDIAYVNDTGRNWHSTKSNLSDRVRSNISADFRSGSEFLCYLKGTPHSKMVFQVHPERWNDGVAAWTGQLCKDMAINAVKAVLVRVRSGKEAHS